MMEYKHLRKIQEEEEVLDSKFNERENWRKNGVFTETEVGGIKLNNQVGTWGKGKKICKAKLGGRKHTHTDALTCASETLKICIANAKQSVGSESIRYKNRVLARR